MKIATTFTLILLGFGLLGFKSDSTTIDFSTSLEKAKVQAKKENKLIFVDNYATWCGPCKKLDANVFNDKELADYFNKTFINVKIDVEKGEGPSVKQKYKINSVPTLLFLDHEGNVKHRAIGYMNKTQLLKTAKDLAK